MEAKLWRQLLRIRASW